ncbi:MAG: pyruvate dehydrogenase complex dihydrolipoyllysine-residue acetyltransferase, partial [Pseudomonadota bacterium]
DIVELEVEGGADGGEETSAPASDSQPNDAPAKEDKPKEPTKEQAPAAKKASGSKQTVDIKVPDLGGSDNVEIIEVAVSAGDD